MIESIVESINLRKNTFVNRSAEEMDNYDNGIYFMYSSWSHSFLQLSHLIASLETFPNIPLYIFDTDDLNTDKIKFRFNVYSHGWGETFWIKNGKTIFFKMKFTSNEIEDLIKNNSLFTAASR